MPPPPLIWGVGFNYEKVPEFMEHCYGSLFKSNFEKQIPKKLKYKKSFEVLKVHKMFKCACIILLLLFKGEKRKRSHIGNTSNYLWGKKRKLFEKIGQYG